MAESRFTCVPCCTQARPKRVRHRASGSRKAELQKRASRDAALRAAVQAGTYEAGSRPREAVCIGCSRVFPVRDRRYTSYCSRACAFRHKAARPRERAGRVAKQVSCIVCTQAFTTSTNAGFCSDACRRARARDRSNGHARAKAQARPPRPCKECGRTFAPAYGTKRRTFCSAECGTRWAVRLERKKRGPDNHRKRARRAGVAYEPVKRTKIFERDGWHCQICGCATPRARMGTMHPQAPELDHRVPLVLGGGHTWANLQTACRRCNAAKGGTRVVGQLPLFARAA